MSLNELPAELTARIVSYLAQLETTDPSSPARPKTSISQYASTSIDIRHAVEQLIFSALTITLDDLPAFEKRVTSSQCRQALLRDLMFQPVLPAYSENACT